MSKKSIRFFNDREVRAVWDEEKSLWWFSIVDIVGAITDSPSPRKYWSVLKTRLKKAGNELTTRCSQLKMTAADGHKSSLVLRSQHKHIAHLHHGTGFKPTDAILFCQVLIQHRFKDGHLYFLHRYIFLYVIAAKSEFIELTRIY